jgi:hypothetical protein
VPGQLCFPYEIRAFRPGALVPGQLCFSYEIRKRLVSKPCLDTTFSVSELDDKQRNLRVPLFAFVGV